MNKVDLYRHLKPFQCQQNEHRLLSFEQTQVHEMGQKNWTLCYRLPHTFTKKNHSLVLSFSSLFLYLFIFFYNDGFHLLSRQKIWEPMCENWLLHHNVDENSKSGKSGKPGTFDRMEVEKFEKLTVWYIFKDAFYMWLYAWWFKRKKSVKKEKESYFSDRF